MALPPSGETQSQDKANYLPQSNPHHLTAYYAHAPGYSHFRNLSSTSTEEDFQPWKLAAAVLESQAMSPRSAFRMTAPLLNPGLAVQSEPLYNLPWYKLSPWNRIPQFAPEVPRFLDSTEHRSSGSSNQNLVPGGGGGGQISSQWWKAENLLLPSPVIASLVPDGIKTSQSESVPQTLNQEGKLPFRGFNFTEEELRFVLYGAIASPEHPANLQHAISGILVPTESSGKEIYFLGLGWVEQVRTTQY